MRWRQTSQLVRRCLDVPETAAASNAACTTCSSSIDALAHKLDSSLTVGTACKMQSGLRHLHGQQLAEHAAQPEALCDAPPSTPLRTTRRRRRVRAMTDSSGNSVMAAHKQAHSHSAAEPTQAASQDHQAPVPRRTRAAQQRLKKAAASEEPREQQECMVSSPHCTQSADTCHNYTVMRLVADCVAASRFACRMRWLNGAAPVCYGLPAVFVRGGGSSNSTRHL